MSREWIPSEKTWNGLYPDDQHGRCKALRWDVLYIAVGAILGAYLRYKITSQNLFFNGLPVSVLIVNVVGSLVHGVSATTIAPFGFDARLTLLIGIGFCGALTTMSSFAYETIRKMGASEYRIWLKALFGYLDQIADLSRDVAITFRVIASKLERQRLLNVKAVRPAQ
jgi:CrcB protein